MARRTEETLSRGRKKKPILISEESEIEIPEFEMEEEEDDPTEPPFSMEPTSEDPVQVILTKLKGEVEDIFVDLGDRAYKEAGVALRYTIYKDGFRMGEFRHPCSWDFLHKKFGGGSYKVQAKSPEGKFLKQQSQMLGDLPEEPKVQEQVKTEIAQVTELVKQLIDNKNDPKNDSLTMMMAMMQQQQQQTQLMMAQMQEQAKLQMAQMQQQTQSQMQMMMTVLGSAKDESTNMSLKMAELQKDAAKQITDANNRIFEIILNKKPEKTGPDAMELIKLKTDAENEGFERAKTMFEMIEEKSDVIAERKAMQLASREDEAPEKKSTMDKVIETLAPALSSVLTQSAQARPRMMPQQAIRRAPVPPIAAPVSSGPASVKSEAAPVTPSVLKPKSGLGVTQIPIPVVASEKVERERGEAALRPAAAPLAEVKEVKEVKMSEEPPHDVTKIKEDLKEMSVSILVGGYLAGKTTTDCASEVFQKAKETLGINKSDVQRYFPKPEIIEIGKEKGLSGDLMKLVEEFAEKVHS